MKKVIIAIISSMLIVYGISGAILAGESHTFSSKGRLVYDNGTLKLNKGDTVQTRLVVSKDTTGNKRTSHSATITQIVVY